jgi:hypothetical protein
MPETIGRASARALDLGRPIKVLAGRSSRSTAKSWATGRRRPPIVRLKILRDLLKDRQAAISGLIYQLDYDITQREREPKLRRGLTKFANATGREAYRLMAAIEPAGRRKIDRGPVPPEAHLPAIPACRAGRWPHASWTVARALYVPDSTAALTKSTHGFRRSFEPRGHFE